MEEHITVSTFEGAGDNAKLFRIPNNTDDYIEITNYGCRMKSIHIHDRQGGLRNVLCGGTETDPAAWIPLAGSTGCPGLEAFLARQVWDIGEVGANHVFFSCTAPAGETGLPCEVKAGAKITWVNLNRLIVDFYLTPEREQTLDLTTGLLFRLAEDGAAYVARTFCPMVDVNGMFVPAAETPYREISFCPVGADEQRFLDPQEDIKPMMELANTAAGLAISAYGTPSVVSCLPQGAPAGVRLRFTAAPEQLRAGETLTERVIYGFDPLPSEAPGEPEEDIPSPFAAFF